MKDSQVVPLLNVQKEEAIAKLEECNAYSSRYGMSLSNEEMKLLVQERYEALQKYGRMEFGSGVMEKIIVAFCDSSYVWQENYATLLSELQEMFYYFKNESLDDFTDDELIQLMRMYFDGECQGSIEYLQETKLSDICKCVREGEEGYTYLDHYDDEDYEKYR